MLFIIRFIGVVVRYHPDFCSKYSHKSDAPLSLPMFTEKLKAKKQPHAYLRQAEHDITLYYNLINAQRSNINEYQPEDNNRETAIRYSRPAAAVFLTGPCTALT